MGNDVETIRYQNNFKTNSSKIYPVQLPFVTQPDDNYELNKKRRFSSLEVSRLPSSPIDLNQSSPNLEESYSPSRDITAKANDQILQKLTLQNEGLRKQLKQISDELTAQVKKKKLIPKRESKSHPAVNASSEDKEYGKPSNEAGIKRQLENGYRQIAMYRRTIQELKGQNGAESESNFKVDKLTSKIKEMDTSISATQKQIEAVRNVKDNQDRNIQKDMNGKMVDAVQGLKSQLELLKTRIKEQQKRERTKELSYKKQQAYLCEIDKKMRLLNGDYAPTGKKNSQKLPYNSEESRIQHQNSASSANIDPYESLVLVTEVANLKHLHQDYHRRIDVLRKAKVNMDEEAINIEKTIKDRDVHIEALRSKIDKYQKLLKPIPLKLGIFAPITATTSLPAAPTKQTKTEDEELLPLGLGEDIDNSGPKDMFDIRHLLSNVANVPSGQRPPMPPQKRVQKPVNLHTAQKVLPSVGNQKSQVRSWTPSMVRFQERGHFFKSEIYTDDREALPNSTPNSQKPRTIGMQIYLNKNSSIIGIQAVYLCNGQLRYGRKSVDSIDGFVVRYDLQSPDYLKNVAVAINEQGFIDQITLFSKKGKVGTYGSKIDGQDVQVFGITGSQRVYGFRSVSVAFGQEYRLCRLGVDICPEENAA